MGGMKRTPRTHSKPICKVKRPTGDPGQAKNPNPNPNPRIQVPLATYMKWKQSPPIEKLAHTGYNLLSKSAV
ncbi:hypothetical protein M5D96_000539 [Drosophila gunungcola]|uniref:Uncharacterized protein n=1 Tax=Drosophila gunungcola TaxID=103775 RepID=A0A9P9YWH0_9MUSC|nr:hypothetical protein M5D96_000539 [Drosophila gunungcola]